METLGRQPLSHFSFSLCLLLDCHWPLHHFWYHSDIPLMMVQWWSTTPKSGSSSLLTSRAHPVLFFEFLLALH